MSQLTIHDYKAILNYYKKPIPKSKKVLKKEAEQLLAKNLCRCINKDEKQYKSRAVGICTKSVINKKGYSRGKFTCKNGPTIRLLKNKTRKRKSK